MMIGAEYGASVSSEGSPTKVDVKSTSLRDNMDKELNELDENVVHLISIVNSLEELFFTLQDKEDNPPQSYDSSTLLGRYADSVQSANSRIQRCQKILQRIHGEHVQS